MNKPQEHTTPNGNVWYRLENDAYGNPRVMTHFLNLVSPTLKQKANDMRIYNEVEKIEALERWAKIRVNGKSYRAKWFGGGIVWTSYLNDEQFNNLIDGIQTK